jgi:hypothetical protein
LKFPELGSNISIEGFVKITQIGTVPIPDRQKPSELYHDDTGCFCNCIMMILHDTGIILVAILEALPTPSDTN